MRMRSESPSDLIGRPWTVTRLSSRCPIDTQVSTGGKRYDFRGYVANDGINYGLTFFGYSWYRSCHHMLQVCVFILHRSSFHPNQWMTIIVPLSYNDQGYHRLAWCRGGRRRTDTSAAAALIPRIPDHGNYS